MMTAYWRVDPAAGSEEPAILEAARLLREGKRVAFPTETVYGLGADARSTDAVAGIFSAKGRPSDNPLIVHIADRSQLDGLVRRPDDVSAALMDAFWPGPLTLVLPVVPGAVSPLVTAGLATVGVRMPDHPAALALLRAAGCPVAAPSANRSGKPSPTRAEHVLADLGGAIEGVLDAGPTGVGLESTVVEVADGAVHILRPGGVSAEALERVAATAGVRVIAAGAETGDDSGVGTSAAGTGAAGTGAAGAPGAEALDHSAALTSAAAAAASGAAGVPPGKGHAPKAPGMKYAHYAPQGRLSVVQGASPEAAMAWIRQDIARAKAAGERTGVLTRTERAGAYDADAVIACGSEGDPASVARGLYEALRGFDTAGATYILAEAVEEAGLGAAVMNRLRKAAGGRVIQV